MIKEITKPWTILCLSLFTFISHGLQEEVLAQDKASLIDEVMTKLVENQQFNGSILVAEDGEVLLKKGYGFANMSWDIPNTADTKFRIGSLTKQFVSMMIMQLVEEKKLKLNGKLSDYLPAYRQDTGKKITIHHLLTHTSGIPSYTDLPGFWSDSIRTPYDTDYLITKFHSGDLEFEPGTDYRYNNTGYFLLAVIIERITGKSYEQNLQERILIPNGMKNSGVDRNHLVLKNKASGYLSRLTGYINEPYFYMLNALGASDMYSTVEDLYLWDQALYHEDILSEKYKKIMFTPFLNNYAYGWGIYNLEIVGSSDSIKVISHSGGIYGFNAEIFRLVEDGHLIILLNNTGFTNLWNICMTITKILYDKYYDLPKKSLVHTLGKTILASGIKYAFIQYHLLKIHKFNEYNFGEDFLDELGYQLLYINLYHEAIEIFKLNIEEYPEAFKPYSSLGEAYSIIGQKSLAIKYYKKSLELNPENTNALKMIEKLNQSN